MNEEEIKEVVQKELKSIYARIKWFLYGVSIFMIVLISLKLSSTTDILRIVHQFIFPIDTNKVHNTLLPTFEEVNMNIDSNLEKIQNVEKKIEKVESRINRARGYVEFQTTMGQNTNSPKFILNVLGPANDLDLIIDETRVLVTYNGTSTAAIVSGTYSKQGSNEIPSSEVLGQMNLDLAVALNLTETRENGTVVLSSNYRRKGMIRINLKPI